MSAVLVPFTPSATSVFQFSPVLNGTTYQATVTWNVFGQRYYVNLATAAGAHVLTTAVVSSGPRLRVALSWANGYASAQAGAPHSIPIGECADLRISDTGTGYDGQWQAFATGADSFSYVAPNPEVATSPTGTAQQLANMVGGVLPGALLLFHFDTLQFEYEDPT